MGKIKKNIQMPVKVYTSCDEEWDKVILNFDYDLFHLRNFAKLDAFHINGNAKLFYIFEDDFSFLVPLIIRKLPNTLTTSNEIIYDAISPYGYPGILFKSFVKDNEKNFRRAINIFICELKKQSICSVFIRLNTFLNYNLSILDEFGQVISKGETVWIDLKKSKQERFNEMRTNHKRVINKLKKLNLKFVLDNDLKKFNEFKNVYYETMKFVDAEESYFFNNKYFESMKNNLGLFINHFYIALDEEYLCGGLFSCVNGSIQYYLGGTSNSARKLSPSRLMFESVANWGSENGFEILNLGGGLGGNKDSLFNFKAGFSKERSIFNVWNLIVDQQIYNQLVSKNFNQMIDFEKDNKKFFPRYRQKTHD